MTQAFDLLETKDFILLILGAVSGYVISLIVARQTEKKKDLVLEVLGRQIVVERSNHCPFLITDQDGIQLDNIYFFVVRIWNRGREAVRGDEISTDAPLMIEVGEEARVLGDPHILKPHLAMRFSIASPEPNKFVFSFDCLNQDEWVQLGFYIAGDPRAVIKGSGRVFGQHLDFDITTDDSRIGLVARLVALTAFVLIAGSPFALAGSLWWAYNDYTIADIFFNPEQLPRMLMALFFTGAMTHSIAAFYFASIWFKRIKNPKGYPIREDFEPNQRQSLQAIFLTALRGRRHETSTSLHNYGEIISPSAKRKGADIQPTRIEQPAIDSTTP
ncbi:hypothetical protein [Pseudomonas graminis]|uniref:Uncharacterized protein n=1 Tax=Pseudomonas graminis TaxID=158627 RepID=A0A1C2EEV5_9PSED|nr:hypothetical protein [Pseudomonas graminis]OCX25505.1 hypothetical protein BBI10_02125 [Pseudomonas graminis]